MDTPPECSDTPPECSDTPQECLFCGTTTCLKPLRSLPDIWFGQYKSCPECAGSCKPHYRRANKIGCRRADNVSYGERQRERQRKLQRERTEMETELTGSNFSEIVRMINNLRIALRKNDICREMAVDKLRIIQVYLHMKEVTAADAFFRAVRFDQGRIDKCIIHGEVVSVYDDNNHLFCEKASTELKKLMDI